MQLEQSAEQLQGIAALCILSLLYQTAACLLKSCQLIWEHESHIIYRSQMICKSVGFRGLDITHQLQVVAEKYDPLGPLIN